MSAMRPRVCICFAKHARPTGSPFLFCLMGWGRRTLKQNAYRIKATLAHHVHNETQVCICVSQKKQTKYLTISIRLDGWGGGDPQAPCLTNLRNALTTSTILPKGVYLFRERCQAKGLTISVLLDGGGTTLKQHA